MKKSIREAYIDRYGQEPAWIARAPGRVNLIGEHTDYNDGFVLPMAIDLAIWMALGPIDSSTIRLYSINFKQEAKTDLNDLKHNDQGWLEYVKGMAWALQQSGYSLAGWQGIVWGEIPIGAGLSSSAAMELVSARSFAAVSGFDWDPVQMATLAQRAENEWVGVNCGIMDQLISAMGKSGHALFIDCRSLDTRPVKLPPETTVIVMDTNTRRGLVDSAYNERRSQCEEAAKLLGVSKLRDIDLDTLEENTNRLDPTVYKRARHVISENSRVLDAVEAMDRGDALKVGQLMNASHESLRDDYEVSSPELDVIVSAAQEQPGCFGARMMGAGFGGCAVAVVTTGSAPGFVDLVSQLYKEQTGLNPSLTICQAAKGAELMNVP
ncbi:MAG: galactokinase [Anaerolineae bacterium]|nr:MAG: galactokinase [Anaerolineae bacterium]